MEHLAFSTIAPLSLRSALGGAPVWRHATGRVVIDRASVQSTAKLVLEFGSNRWLDLMRTAVPRADEAKCRWCCS